MSIDPVPSSSIQNNGGDYLLLIPGGGGDENILAIIGGSMIVFSPVITLCPRSNQKSCYYSLSVALSAVAGALSIEESCYPEQGCPNWLDRYGTGDITGFVASSATLLSPRMSRTPVRCILRCISRCMSLIRRSHTNMRRNARSLSLEKLIVI